MTAPSPLAAGADPRGLSPVVGLSPARATWLIAQREVSTRMRQRSYLITTALLVVAVVAGILVAHATAGGGSTVAVGATDQTTATAVEQALDAAGLDATVTTVTDRAAGERQVRDGDLDALIVPADGGSLTTVVDRELNARLAPVLDGLARQQALTAQITALGGDPTTVAAAVGQAGVQVDALDPPVERDLTQVIAGYLVGIVMFMALMMCSQLVAQGVVEEKTSRVVELLLATVRPSHLMAGKVAGIGLVGLIQVAVTVGAAAIASSATGLLDTSGLRVGPTLVWALVWFLVGFVTYAFVLAALAALVSRQEEVSSVITPVTMLMLLPYIYGISVLPWDPANALARTLSFIPLLSPFLMPMRLALGTAPLWEPFVALALALAVVPLLIWLSGRIYANAVLRTGARVRLKDALRA
ncbi:ABC transporter permease [Xylanimonas ulmi]|uniref:ABC-2 type transport system permease protein n=1 Tax=Xylanimonas ulmi TaxID=228973 RepID=A0A4Q7M4D5_9MICO|nr:ABC transporter permease [Xylanibacterium ulmi]RZS61873.1 ABC-2 type transport system permease protein [Xylanibacterium ulmi]